MKNRFENFVFKYDFRAPKMKDSCRIHLVPEFLTKCNIMLQFCKSTNSGKTIYLFCILFAFICLQNSSMHPVLTRRDLVNLRLDATSKVDDNASLQASPSVPNQFSLGHLCILYLSNVF